MVLATFSKGDARDDMILGGQKMQSLLKRFESKDKDKDDIQSHRVPFNMTFGHKRQLPTTSKIKKLHVQRSPNELIKYQARWMRPWRSEVGFGHGLLGLLAGRWWAGSMPVQG